MVKCPKAAIPQMRRNLTYTQRSSTFSFDDSFFSWVYDPHKGRMVYVGDKDEQTLGIDSEDQESEINQTRSLTPRQYLVQVFVSDFLDILLESWEGKPCLKHTSGDYKFVPNDSEEFGEDIDLGPCEDSMISSPAHSLRDLFHKRTTQLYEEKSPLNKTKIDQTSTDSEYLNEEDFQASKSSAQWRNFVPDEDVHLVFLNGSRYNGTVSGRLMEGDGVYFWDDGCTFRGEFLGGYATGKGRLEFPELSVYEGGVHKGFRHGDGMFCFSDSPVMYCGQWWLGKKHGYGLMVYDDPSKNVSFYRGQWEDGAKEGLGFRQYPSGAIYMGFWSNGKRHGRGIMFWSNHDIYRGYWKEGLMHGYGEYTWDGFINKTLSYPATNTYRGSWVEGKRSGRGTFEVKNGAFIETFWVENMKDGPGAVVCCNGTLVAAEGLFSKDKQALVSAQKDSVGFRLRNPVSIKTSEKKKGSSEDNLLDYVRSFEKSKAISIPIHSPVHSINLRPHLQKYHEQKRKALQRIAEKQISDFEIIRIRDSDTTVENDLSSEDSCLLSQSVMQEEKHLRNLIISRYSQLKACYDYYTNWPCEKPALFRCVMIRMFFWQMLIDVGIHRLGVSIIEIDNLLACEEYLLIDNRHDPYERIKFWQFIHTLICLSWYLFGQHVLRENPLVVGEETIKFLEYFKESQCKSIFKTAFEYFIENIIGKFYKEFNPEQNDKKKNMMDLVPMEALYSIYQDVGEGHSARDFLNSVCRKNRRREEYHINKYFEKLPAYKIDGKNILSVAGELNHLPGPEPFNFPQIFKLEAENSGKSDLTYFSDLKARGVINCLIRICPGIMRDDLLVNMDYELTFLEFYEVIILCAELATKLRIMREKKDSVIREYREQLEEYEKQFREYEKAKENSGGVSRKKSRQFTELKKGRK